jgi:hypothetical protein
LYVFIASLTLFLYHLPSLLRYVNPLGTLGVGGYLSSHLTKALNVVFGHNISTFVVPALFWGSVGFIVYIFVSWLVRDLAVVSEALHERRKFMFPQNAHPRLLSGLIEKVVMEIATLFVTIIYFGHVISFFLHGKVSPLPFLGTTVANWLQNHWIYNNVLFFIAELIALHGLVILFRLLLRRRRIISSY